MNNKVFRKDINGLRAIAVLAVVIFHYNSSWLPGGFSGVDVFFVISGFLMTKIIYTGLINNNFSLYTFLINRFTRIVPALTAVVLLFLGLGYIFFEPLSYKVMGEHAFSSLLFYSNITYLNEMGYFDVGSLSKIFLHSWSLSIEWQFYVIYPILLIILFNFFSAQNVKKLILFITIILFILNIYISIKFTEQSYFMLSSRAWEMLIGGIAYLYPRNYNRNNNMVEFIGLALIISGYIFLSHVIEWPSFYALIPTVGAYLIISYNKSKSLLDNKLLQFIGKISYSIYLIHWPVIVFFNKLQFKISFILYISITIILATALYFTIEKRRAGLFKYFIFFIATVFFSFYIKQNGVSHRLTDTEFNLSLKDFRYKYEGHLGLSEKNDRLYLNASDNDFDYILIGDSHARHLYSYIAASGKKVVSLALDGCLSTENFYSKYNAEKCSLRYEQAIRFINENPNKTIIWSARWSDNPSVVKRDSLDKFDLKNELELFIEKINKNKLYLIGTTPDSGYIAYECLAKNSLPINKFFNNFNCQNSVEYKKPTIDDVLIDISKSHSNIEYIKASDALCDSSRCMIIDNNAPIFTDTHHLTKYGAELVGSYIFNEIEAKKLKESN